MHKYALLSLVLVGSLLANAQTYSRQEIGVAASGISGTPSPNSEIENPTHHFYPGPSGRYTWNLSPSLALEGDVSFHFRDENHFSTAKNGDLLMVAGIKAGWRGKTIGVFGYVKPGFMWFPSGIEELFPVHQFFSVGHFALQEGATFEYYPTQRLIIRADVGQTLVSQFEKTNLHTNEEYSYLAGAIDDHLNLSVGANYRLGELREEAEPVPRSAPAEVGILFPLQLRKHLEYEQVQADSGAGAWLSAPVWRYVSLDASGFYLPADDHTYNPQDGGPAAEVYGGVKAGIRRDHMGYFAKVRPGFIEFDHGLAALNQTGSSTFSVYSRHVTDFALDTGAVLEVYPSTHTLLRIDAGNAFIHYHGANIGVNNGSQYSPPLHQSSILLTFGAGWRF